MILNFHSQKHGSCMFLNEMGPAKELDGRYSTPQAFQACRCRAYSKQTLVYKIKERNKQKKIVLTYFKEYDEDIDNRRCRGEIYAVF